MAEGKKSFIAYSDWKGTFDSLPDEIAGKLIKHIFAYVNDENPTTEDYVINAIFSNIKNTLKRDLSKWDKQYKQRVNAGKRSAEVRKRNSTVVERSLNGRNVSSTVSGNVSVTVNDNVKVNNTIEYRESEFKNSLQPYLEEFGKDILNEFYLYWTEKKPKGRKMLFEMQKTFDIKRRLDRWNKNNFNKKEKTSDKKEKQSASDILMNRYGIK